MKFWKKDCSNQPDPLWDMKRLPRVGYFSNYDLITRKSYQAPLYLHKGTKVKRVGKAQQYKYHNEEIWGTSCPDPNRRNYNQGWLGSCLNGHWEPHEIINMVNQQGLKIRQDF